jgi:hypothetical protein
MTISFNNLGIMGRLGNQMFQYSALKSISLRRGYDYVIPDSDFKDPWRDHQLFDVFKMESISKKNLGRIRQTSLYEGHFHFNEGLYRNCADCVDLYGYFQSEKYFISIKSEILKDFQFHDHIVDPCIEMISSLNSPIALHVRRGDYLEKSNEHPPQAIEYYEEALSNFSKTRNIIVFTDDIEWCKKQKLFSSDRFLISESKNSKIDLCLMTLCTDYIIANSSFSWWGAWLSKNDDPIVISPKKWFGTTGYTKNNNTKDLIPNRWRTI